MGLAQFTASANSSPALLKRHIKHAENCFLVKFKLWSGIIGSPQQTGAWREERVMVNQQPHRSRGVKVLKAVSSPLRLQILNLLFDKSALSYTELMNQLKMNPSRDAGRFAYHLKFLLKADLVEADVEAKKYYLTDLGKMVLDVADRVEKKAVKPKGMLVRTSHLTVKSSTPTKLPTRSSKKQRCQRNWLRKQQRKLRNGWLNQKPKYLTASLIREVVNGILVEKGFEDYRHKLTRVGMPVHEVTALIEDKDAPQNCASTITRAGKTVLGEYTLLNIFPRDISDAHLSGALHIDGLGTWMLKPNEVMHDLRFFLPKRLKPDNIMQLPMKPPTNLRIGLIDGVQRVVACKQRNQQNPNFRLLQRFPRAFRKGR